MNNIKTKRIKELVQELNYHRNLYYNNSNPEISDYEYDNLYDELIRLEKETGIALSNSPTVTVGYEVKSKLEKIKHSHPMLSLDKTKSINDLIEFAGDNGCLLMHKLDGLTVLLTYDNGNLIQAETRGNGEEGELITHNAKVFKNVPHTIPYKGLFEIEGEAIIYKSDFEKINNSLSEREDKYKNPRNLVAGSVRQLDNSIAADRNINFIAWKVPTDIASTMHERFILAKSYGFDIVSYFTYTNDSDDKANINKMIEALKIKSDRDGVPIDGLVMSYNDIEYGMSLGKTGHHPRHSIAFKFYDEEIETELLDIIYDIGKNSGVLTPVAIFNPIEINGTTVERASLFNMNILRETLGKHPYKFQKIFVTKRNEIIPHVEWAEKCDEENENTIYIPTVCPICGSATEIIRPNQTELLICSNPDCNGKLLGKLSHFVCKSALNIDGLSDATLELLYSQGYISSYKDIYHLNDTDIMDKKISGLGKKSKEKLLQSIENSRNTELYRFINALSIPGVGTSASKDMANKIINSAIKKDFGGCEYGNLTDWFIETIGINSNEYWKSIEGIGDKTATEIVRFFEENWNMINELIDEFVFKFEKTNSSTNLSDKNNCLEGKSFCITGSLNKLNNRDEFISLVEVHGGKYMSGVSSKLNYLVINDLNSTSSKAIKARQCGVNLINEQEFLNMIGNN